MMRMRFLLSLSLSARADDRVSSRSAWFLVDVRVSGRWGDSLRAHCTYARGDTPRRRRAR
jgi:hypothetical protein